jgi:hypothetical protein
MTLASWLGIFGFVLLLTGCAVLERSENLNERDPWRDLERAAGFTAAGVLLLMLGLGTLLYAVTLL